MATFALIHGGDGSAWDWHLVARELREDGHDPTAVDLPCEDESAGWWDYADAVVGAIGDRSEVVVVGHSLGAFTAPLVCARIPVDQPADCNAARSTPTSPTPSPPKRAAIRSRR